MDFRILGPLEVVVDGRPLTLGGHRRRALLALLLVHANRPVATDRLIEELWGERLGATPRKTLQMHVSRLRRELGPAIPLVTHAGGYELRVGAGDVDAWRFEAQLDDGRRALADGRGAEAAERLDGALRLWRGAVLADLADEPFARHERGRLDDLRLVAHELHVDALLSLGRHDEVIGRLEGLIAQEPYREALRGRLMLALYRADRQAEALQAYQDARRRLVEELGIEPGAHLRELEAAILAQDPALALVAPPGAAPAAPDPLPAEPDPIATRKLVTVLFAAAAAPAADEDGVADPEVREQRAAGRLAAMETVLRRHGATVVRCPGDALMAVFGLPRLHEDDALRALRAAAELRDGARIGVAGGEIVQRPVADGRPAAEGEPVNRAQRLQQRAAVGEVLLDPTTRRLAGARAVTAATTGEAARLIEVRTAPGARREVGLVGRDPQLRLLTEMFDAAVRERGCRLVTVLGAAGVGKSRLAEELVARIGPAAHVRHGRCLSYGEGITYWPLREIVGDAGADLRALLAAEPDAEPVAAALATAVGRGGDSTGETIAWAARRLLETLAAAAPLIVVLDDLQWAEPTFLDLVEHVADLSRTAPILLLCLARPELLDERPGWGGGQLNAASILLEPLDPGAAARHVALLLGDAPAPAGLGDRIAAATEGNPLFAQVLVEELEADGWPAGRDGALPVPLSVHALLAARIDRLPGEERTVLARAAIEGVVFHADAVDAPVDPAAEPALRRLIHRDLIRPHPPDRPGEPAYRFRHGLIRDAAYRSMPKAQRADRHARFAERLAAAGAGSVPELDEIAGYHLEAAAGLLTELGRSAGALPARAARHLEAAGRRALDRGDRAAGTGLLRRALALGPHDDPGRPRLLADLGLALIEAGRLAEADTTLAAAAAAAARAGDDAAAAHARVAERLLAVQRGEAGAGAAATAAVDAVAPVFRRHGDELGLARATALAAWLRWIEADAHGATAAWEQAAVHAGRAGAERDRIAVLGWIASAQFFGPVPAARGIERCAAIRAEVGADPAAVAAALQPLAALIAMQGRFGRARALLGEADRALRDLGLALESAVSHHAAIVELLAGDAAAAERGLRRGCAVLEEMGDRSLLSTTVALLGQALVAQGRHAEADACAERAAALAVVDDRLTELLWRGVRARALAARGEREAAERLAREAVAIGQRTDFVNHTADAFADLAIVLGAADRTAAAQAASRRAGELYAGKGNVVGVRRMAAGVAGVGRV